MIFVWNGRSAKPMVRAEALTYGFELDRLLNSSRDILLEFLFNGGVIKG